MKWFFTIIVENCSHIYNWNYIYNFNSFIYDIHNEIRRVLSLEQQLKQTEYNQELFFDIIKRAYEKGMNEKEITVARIVEDLKNDLRNTVVK